MTPQDLISAEAPAGGPGRGARAVFRCAAVMAAAGVIWAVGCGFVVSAAFAALRLLVGPELAALGIGIALLALAALLARRGPGLAAGTLRGSALPQSSPMPSVVPTALAVFTAAFVLGRRLADRWRD